MNKKTASKAKSNHTKSTHATKASAPEPKPQGKMAPVKEKQAETVTSKNVNAPQEKETMKPLRRNDPSGHPQESEETKRIGGDIPESTPFGPAESQKGHHTVDQM